MITAVMKVRNEEHRIGPALEKLSWCDAVIVVDDCSDDSTADLAEQLGARVLRYVRQTSSVDEVDRAGFALVEQGWILRIDVDEEVPRVLQQAIIRAVTDSDSLDVNGFLVARDNVFLGRVLKAGSARLPHHMKLFRAASWDRSWDLRLHSQVPVFGSVRVLDPDQCGAIVHPLYEKVSDFSSRSLTHYARVEACQLGGLKRSTPLHLVTGACTAFSRTFVGQVVFRGTWRDGLQGIVWSLLQALYKVMVLAYRFEMSLNPNAYAADNNWWHHR